MAQTKIHALIAAREERSKAANASIADTTAKFKHKGELYTGFLKITTSLTDERRLELDNREEKPCTTSVQDNLVYTFGLIAKELDVTASLDVSNQRATADIVVGTTTIAKGVPAVTLLALEKKIKSWIEMIRTAPTLPTGISWELDSGHVFKTKIPIIRNKEEKGWQVLTLAPATDKFPAQVSKESAVSVVARIEETQWNGMMPSLEKAQMLSRLDELFIAVNQARQRANETEITEMLIGEALVKYILG